MNWDKNVFVFIFVSLSVSVKFLMVLFLSLSFICVYLSYCLYLSHSLSLSIIYIYNHIFHLILLPNHILLISNPFIFFHPNKYFLSQTHLHFISPINIYEFLDYTHFLLISPHPNMLPSFPSPIQYPHQHYVGSTAEGRSCSSSVGGKGDGKE